MLHIDLDSLEMSRMNSYLREVKNENRQSSGAESVGHDESSKLNCESEENEQPSIPKCSVSEEVSHYPLVPNVCSKKLEELLAQLDLCSTVSDDEETTEEGNEGLTQKNGDSDADRRSSYEKLRQRNEKMAQKLDFRFEDSHFDGGLFSHGVTLKKLEEGLRHLRRLRRFLDTVREVERQARIEGHVPTLIGVQPVMPIPSSFPQPPPPPPPQQQQQQQQQPLPQPQLQWPQPTAGQHSGQGHQAMLDCQYQWPQQMFAEGAWSTENLTPQQFQPCVSEPSVMGHPHSDNSMSLDPELMAILDNTSNSP